MCIGESTSYYFLGLVGPLLGTAIITFFLYEITKFSYDL